MSLYYGENSPELNLAKKVFETFANGSNGLNTHQFRTMFYATGEDLSDNDINDLFGEVDDDRDGSISLEEFTNWFKKDDYYDYNVRTKPLRDVKERLKMPAFFSAIQYLMQKNSNGSGLITNGKKLLDINLKVKIGSMEHQKPAWGVDLRHETYPYDGSNPVLVMEFIWDESREITDAENNMRNVATNFIENHLTQATFEPMQIEGRPGGRLSVDLSQELRQPLQMITSSFLSNLEEFHFWLHTSQKVEELNGADIAIDAGLLFKGNRAFFNVLPIDVAAQLGMPPSLFNALMPLDHVHMNVTLDKLGDVGGSALPPRAVVEKMQKDVMRVINYGASSADFRPFFPMGVRWLKTFTIQGFGHSFVATGIDVDVSFVFNQPFSQEDMNRHFAGEQLPEVNEDFIDAIPPRQFDQGPVYEE